MLKFWLAPAARIFAVVILLTGTLSALAADEQLHRLRCEITDATTGQRLAARAYLRNDKGEWFFPKSEAAEGTAVEYKRDRGNKGVNVEMHTTLSAHPFVADLPPGKYTLEVERGKEYFPFTRTFTLVNEPRSLSIELKRWIDLAEQGWYSGDTHVHRKLDELANVMQAEDLNVAFPLTYWVKAAYEPPGKSPGSIGDSGSADLIRLDDTHVIYPRNTEYEIFTVNGKNFTLGAFFVLNHKSVLDLAVPPVIPMAERARKEGALLELDKHNWPWSMMLVPTMQVDLYELSNNHVWRTAFGFPQFGELAPASMQIERDATGMTEKGWVDFGFQNYYALLNCGFRLRPTAGTASGVHPVPLGFSRVYVHLPNGFDYGEWIKGLNAGRSFVTTGPMLFVRVNGENPGHVFKSDQAGKIGYRILGTACSEQPLDRIEIIAGGEVAETLQPANTQRQYGGFESRINTVVNCDSSTWIAVRCFEGRPTSRFRFAHTGPVHIEMAGKPLRPRKVEVEYLVQRLKAEIERVRDILPESAVSEYRAALKAYEQLMSTAR